MVWENPRGRLGSNTGNSINKGSKADVYERVLVIHHEDGTRQIEQLSQVTDLIIK